MTESRHNIPQTVYIDDTDVSIDNQYLGETLLSYNDNDTVVFSVSIPFALDLVENALENDGRFANGLEGTPAGDAINLLRKYLKGPEEED